MLTEPTHSRSLVRRRVYIGEGLSFQIESETAWLQAEAIDLSDEGLGVAVVLATAVMMPAVGEAVTVRYAGRGASGDRQRAVVRHVGSRQTGRGTLPRIGLSLGGRRDADRRRRPARGRPLPVSGGARGVRGRIVPVVLRRDPALPDRPDRRGRDDAEDDAAPSAAAAARRGRVRPAPGVHRAPALPRAPDLRAPR